MNYTENEYSGLNINEIRECLEKSFKEHGLKKVLLVPPDITRMNSGAGIITALMYDILRNVHVDIMPALGTHTPMSRFEQIEFFGENIPEDKFLVHDWRDGVTKIGEIPRQLVRECSEGFFDEPMDVEISNYLLDTSYDLIVSIGQVVPHEVAGMSNYTKNIVVGCGGSRFINQSHMLGAYCGLERIMGKDNSPVRRIFDYAQEHFLTRIKLEYVLTVTVTDDAGTKILGMYIDNTREGFSRAVDLSRKHNIYRVCKPIKTCIVKLSEKEYRSTWLGNKAIYRTRLAMADKGNLIILAPGINRFGEDDSIDRIIRKYGYIGRERIIKLCMTESELINNFSAAAHLIHGSPDNRFTVTYATEKLSKHEIESVGFKFMPYTDAAQMYNTAELSPGFNKTQSGEEVYYIENPALGLWSS